MIRTAIDEIAVLRRQNDVLSERVAYLEGKLSVLAEECPLEWKLSKSEARLMGLLVRASGRVIERRTLISVMWDTAEPDSANRVLDVFVHKVRKKVSPFGMKIRTVVGVGYCIDRGPAELEVVQ